MNTEKMFQILCGKLDDTLALGEKIGRACKGGEVFELISDLGGGKTAFVRGLAGGIGAGEDVSSPSFTINNTYQSEVLTIEHFDFYRLNEPGLLADQLHEDIFRPDTIVVIEWGDVVQDILPKDRIVVDINVNEDDSRIFTIGYSSKYGYLLREIA